MTISQSALLGVPFILPFSGALKKYPFTATQRIRQFGFEIDDYLCKLCRLFISDNASKNSNKMLARIKCVSTSMYRQYEVMIG